MIKIPAKLQRVWIEEERQGREIVQFANPRMLPKVLRSHCFIKGFVSKFTKLEKFIYVNL